MEKEFPTHCPDCKQYQRDCLCEYPTVEEVLDVMDWSEGWTVTHEYPDYIAVDHVSFNDDQVISFGDVNGYFAFNDVPADVVVGDMEFIVNPKEIVKSFWEQVAKFYPELVKENN